MNTFLDSHTPHNEDELAPGDYYIDTTNVTLFEVMDCQREGHKPWRIAQILGVTSDQVYFALDYLALHRPAVEAVYRADRRAAAQRFIGSLVGTYRPQWQDWMFLIGGMALGVFFLMLAVTTVRPLFVAHSAYSSPFAVVITVSMGIFCILVGLGMLGFGSRLLVDTATLHYTVSATMLTATRYGRIRAYAIPCESVVYMDVRGRFLHITCEDNTTYQMFGLKQLRDAVNRLPSHSVRRDRPPPS